MATHEATGSNDTIYHVTVGDISIAYRTDGSGFPLILIVGYGSTMHIWESAMIQNLSSHYKVILFDNRGIGDSTTGSEPFSIGQFSEDTAGLLNAIGIQQAHVLGWSMGAMIAQELVLRHPEMVSKLILCAPLCDANMFPPSYEVIQKLTDTSGTPEERGMRSISTLFPDEWIENNGQRIGEVFFRPMGIIPEETIGKQSMAIAFWTGTTERLGEIGSPVLLVAGTDDCLVIPENSRFMSKKIPNAQLEMIENAGHGLMFQYPKLFCEKVIDFLKKE